MTSHEPPVYMDEDDDRSSFHSHMDIAAEEEVSVCHLSQSENIFFTVIYIFQMNNVRIKHLS